jgi:single-strand DNA-binding protein
MSAQYPDFVNVVGRVGRDPEVKQTPTGKKVAAFSVAKRTGYGDGATKWFDVEVWGTRKSGDPEPLLAKVQGLQKGQLVGIEATSKDREYNGKTYTTLSAINVWRLTDVGEASDEW